MFILFVIFSTSLSKITYILYTEDNNYLCVYLEVSKLSKDNGKLWLMDKDVLLRKQSENN